MSYTECEGCGKRLWWDDVEYEEIDGQISCFDCIRECDKCGKDFIYEGGDCLCDNCMTSLTEKE
jgi:hypothetical protein